ncbi:glutaredoxin family protein [Ideonella sp. A 288]|uniref:glutaredoxin family protein n=1 Tax=Ideonella sp. A 288 TaxID=1962181 RepID=UPI000B4B7A06|nr:glutaredoxin family protein [Ideonella sp. A 288]
MLGLVRLVLPDLAIAIALLLGPLAGASAASSVPAGPSAPIAAPAALEVFVREGCPHCTAAKEFLAALSRERPALAIHLRQVDQDPQAAEDLMARSRAAGAWPPGVPTFVFRGQVMVGFDDAEHAGRELVALLDGSAAPVGQVEGTLFGTLSASRLGLPLFTLALGLLDGFNPCAMWVLLFLLSLLVRLRDRRRMALVAGTFVLVSSAVYYAFMAAWLNVFLAVGMSNAVRVTLGAVALAIGAVNVKDFVAWGRGPSLSIPDAAKPGLVARMRRVMQAPGLSTSLLAVAALAVVVNVVELLCTAGLPAIYTAVLAQHQLGAAAHYAYLGLYILGYIADDSLMVAAAVLALGSGKLTERAGRWLKFVSGVVMLALGAVLLLRPQWLS